VIGRILLGGLVAGIALAGAGYWNYERNAGLDRELERRPYRTLATGQLRELLGAYRGEAERVDRRLSQTSNGSEQMGSFRDADFAARVESFGKFQRQNRQWRELRDSATDSQGAIADVERELRIREAGLDEEWRRVWRRVSTF
jgi:hypothetical protein